MPTIKQILLKSKAKNAENADLKMLVMQSAEALTEEFLRKIKPQILKNVSEEVAGTIEKEIMDLRHLVKKGDQGDSGEDYILTGSDKAEIASKIKVPVVKKIIEKTEVIKEQPIITNEIKEVAKTDEPPQIANKLNTLEEKVEIKVIKGLNKRFEILGKNIQSTKREKGGGGGEITRSYDLSAETDGATKVFTIPENREVLGVFSTQFPINYRPVIDWTLSGRTLTLTNEVGAPESGQTLWVLYRK